jgi:kynureninase
LAKLASHDRVTALTSEALYATPNAIASDYARFKVAERLLLSGHSHQAWPDVGFEGQQQAWLDAAEYVDEKWERAFARAERVREGYRRVLDDPNGEIALGPATHDLLIKWLSCLPLARRPRIVTTDSEYHSARRQLDRLGESGIVEIVKVAARPAESVGERIAAEIDGRTSAAIVSAVFYENAHLAGDLAAVSEACHRHGVELLVDAYHALNVIPFRLGAWRLENAWITGGGYKYLQLGEGNAFLRIPPGRDPRPVVTGWFAEFDTMTDRKDSSRVAWGRVTSRFASGTYDPTSQYRASEVFDYFARRGLTPELLHEVYRHQVGLLAERFDALGVDPAVIDRDRAVPLERTGAFLALRSPAAGKLRQELFRRGVWCDHRGEIVRFGPAPYLSDRQLEDAVEALGEAVRSLARS